MQFQPKLSSADRLEFLVLAAGWDGGSDPISEVGSVSIAVDTQTVDFSPSGRWLEEKVVEAFSQQGLEAKDDEWIFKRWIILLAKRALFEPTESLVRYV